RPVYAGPVEATAIGNVMMQALACGRVGSIDEARQVIRRSFDLVHYEPAEADAWEDAYGRFLDVMTRAQAAL
ncbi:MAG: rhamnulokinase, partial [Armatimonadota bacterium]